MKQVLGCTVIQVPRRWHSGYLPRGTLWLAAVWGFPTLWLSTRILFCFFPFPCLYFFFLISWHWPVLLIGSYFLLLFLATTGVILDCFVDSPCLAVASWYLCRSLYWHVVPPEARRYSLLLLELPRSSLTGTGCSPPSPYRPPSAVRHTAPLPNRRPPPLFGGGRQVVVGGGWWVVGGVSLARRVPPVSPSAPSRQYLLHKHRVSPLCSLPPAPFINPCCASFVGLLLATPKPMK